jgi:ectoine hydroxylase-related dioxygenase (phytanoyl-CoA dioxygenase family)
VRKLVNRIQTKVVPELRNALEEVVFEQRQPARAPAPAPVATGTKSWRDIPNEIPWFDRPDAELVLERRRRAGELSEADHAMLLKWVRDGYVVIDGAFNPGDIDSMVSTLDGLWDAQEPIPGLVLLSVRENKDATPRNISHEDLLKLDKETRMRMRHVSDWRIHGFQNQNAAANRIYLDAHVRSSVAKIFGQPAFPHASINFMYGSEQALHQDMSVFHIHPWNYLIGAWIACEDISDDAGPLVFCPGSHRAAMYGAFTDYPQTNLRTTPPEVSKAYNAYADELSKNYVRKHFLGKKGQVLLWHGMLLHGGSPIKNRELSRKSMVVHYMTADSNRHEQVSGPFNW